MLLKNEVNVTNRKHKRATETIQQLKLQRTNQKFKLNKQAVQNTGDNVINNNKASSQVAGYSMYVKL